MVVLRSPKPPVGVRFPPPVLLYETRIERMGLFRELFRYRRYKTSQGKLIRRLTMTGAWVLFATAAWKCTLMDFTWIARWYTWLVGWETQSEQAQAFVSTFIMVFPYSMAGLILLFGLWFGYRLVKWVTFADFLISVEGEMAKVSWPNQSELRSATIVVLTLFFLLAGVLYTFDLIFVFIFKFIGVV